MEDATRPENRLLCRTASASYFFSMWKERASEIKTRKIHRFTKCSDCELYRVELARAGLHLVKCQTLKKGQSSAYKIRYARRLEYASKRDKARRNPDSFCSLIVDGADQSAYGLPHLVYTTKAMRGDRLRVRLIGVKEHLPIPNIFLYLLTEEFET